MKMNLVNCISIYYIGIKTNYSVKQSLNGNISFFLKGTPIVSATQAHCVVRVNKIH